MSPAGRAIAGFTARHGRPPTGAWSAPGRVTLVGEHTDYNDGLVLPFALPQRTTVAAAPRADGLLTCVTLTADGASRESGPLTVADLAPGTVLGWAAYPAGVAWALAAHGLPVPGADLVVASDVPAGAGLASSAALECAVSYALLALAGLQPDGPGAPSRTELAALAQWAENEFVGVPTGVLDQTAAMCCVAGHALLLDVASGEQQQLPFDTAAAGLTILVVDTRVRHVVAESGYAERRVGCRRAAELLGVRTLRELSPTGLGPDEADLEAALGRLPTPQRPLVRHVVTENDRVLTVAAALQAGEPERIGPTLTSSHTSLREDYQVSCPELDLAVEAALGAGALGARMTGAGFGGSVIALLRAGTMPAVEEAVVAAFARHGFAEPSRFVAQPSAGAARDQ